jgi:hypothetical protein
MIPEEKVKPPDAEAAKNGEEDSPKEDSDRARREAFRRMFPDVPGKPERLKKSSE